MAAYISFQPSDYFNLALYTGNGSTQTISGIGFQPDLTWIKERNGTEYHRLYDSARGVYKEIYSNADIAEASNTNSLTAWNADGFALGTETGVNNNTDTFVAWNWKAGTTTGIAGSPSITPTGYTFDQTSGFSAVAYTANNTAGATIPHGLGVAPDVALFKCTSYAENWNMYNKNLTGGTAATYTIRLNNTANEATTDNYNDTAQTSTTLFTMGNAGEINESTRTYVAYFFKEKRGYSKFGRYIGNGNAEGPCIYTGFRPAFVITKPFQGSTNAWYMMDRLRSNPRNPQDGRLEADSQGAENDTAIDIDFCANGFKIRSSEGGFNTNSSEYLFFAFAEFPLVSSNSKSGVAR